MVGCFQKQLNLGDGFPRVTLQIWDTAGQERYHCLNYTYYKEANAALLVYDITDTESFVKVKAWIKELHKFMEEDAIIVTVGNKIDLNKLRVITPQEENEFAGQIGAHLFNTSAKTGRHVEEPF